MKNTQLQFDSLLNLYCFIQKAKLTEIEIISNKRLLCGMLSANQVKLAEQYYNASELTSASTNAGLVANFFN